MKIQIGLGSSINPLSDADLTALNEEFNRQYSGIDVTIKLNFLFSDDTDESDGADDRRPDREMPDPNRRQYLRYVVEYTHPLSPEKKVWFSLEQYGEHMNVHAGVSQALEKYRQQTQTCAHHFVPQKDEFGNDFPDGRGICHQCDLALDAILDKKPGVTLISMSLDPDVVAQYHWGPAYVQGGRCGVVVSTSSKKCYTTAFVEAFPTIDGFSTFIRGEGANVREAEDACWELYQRQLKCPGHEWSRMVRGAHRSDGYAQCVHCGLSASGALEPETLCRVCQAPTNKMIDNEYVCLTHYYQIPEDERAAAYVRMMTDHKDSESEQVRYDFDYRLKSRLEHYAFEQLGNDQYKAIQSQLGSILGFLKRNFYVCMLDVHPLKNADAENYGLDAYQKMDECHEHTKKNWNYILQFIYESAANKKLNVDERKKLRGVHISDVIPEHYLMDKSKSD